MVGTTVQKIIFRGATYYLKRDDLYAPPDVRGQRIPSSLKLGFSGNKARKLHHYIQADLPEIRRLVSYGSAQSNMLFSLSCLAKLKGWKLDFYVDHIASHLEQNPRGNYAAALVNGAQIHSLGDKCRAENISLARYVEAIVEEDEAGLYIPEGGHFPQAEQGIKILAEEIQTWVSENNIKDPCLMLPSGTGTTALYLQKHLNFKVLTCACVGSMDYLRQQFSCLSQKPRDHPEILQPPPGAHGQVRKYHFGKCYPEFYSIWRELKEQTGVCFDLLYDPLGWICLLEYLHKNRVNKDTQQGSMIYLHQGGLLGNDSMRFRYERASRRAKETEL